MKCSRTWLACHNKFRSVDFYNTDNDYQLQEKNDLNGYFYFFPAQAKLTKFLDEAFSFPKLHKFCRYIFHRCLKPLPI